MKNKRVIIGSRESKLAVIQSRIVADFIETTYADRKVELLTMKTSGDKILDRSLDKIGGKGLFVKELDRALAEGRSHLSVHSLKDMPMEVPDNLPLLGCSKREDVRDVLILPKGQSDEEIKGPIGCCAKRRIVQLKRLYPKADFKEIRGNVLTRLEKLDRGEYGALVLAAAGIHRLGLTDRISKYFTVEEILPAAGQGILAVQGRSGEDYSYLEAFFDRDSFYAACAERSFVSYLDGGCSSPVAAYAELRGQHLSLRGLYYKENSGEILLGNLEGRAEDAKELGIRLAQKLRGF